MNSSTDEREDPGLTKPRYDLDVLREDPKALANALAAEAFAFNNGTGDDDNRTWFWLLVGMATGVLWKVGDRREEAAEGPLW